MRSRSSKRRFRMPREDFDNAKAACQDAMTALESKKREVQGRACFHRFLR